MVCPALQADGKPFIFLFSCRGLEGDEQLAPSGGVAPGERAEASGGCLGVPEAEAVGPRSYEPRQILMRGWHAKGLQKVEYQEF